MSVGKYKGEPGVRQPEWFDQGTCRVEKRANEIFFPVAEADEGPAKKICKRCPVIETCLDFAIETRQPDGIWGGKNFKERRALRNRRQKRKASV